MSAEAIHPRELYLSCPRSAEDPGTRFMTHATEIGAMRTVFHVSSADPDRWDRAVGNVNNLLDDESVDLEEVVLVANSGGIDAVRKGSPVEGSLEGLIDRGVHVGACRNTLRNAGLAREDLIDGVSVVSSAMGELTRRQTAGYAYIKP